MRRFVVTGVLACALAASAAAPAAAAGNDASRVPALKSAATGARAGQIRAAQEYKASLERLLELREAELRRATEALERVRQLAEQGLVARYDVTVAERAVNQARARVDETWNEAIVAASIIAQALAQDELAASPAPLPGTEQVTASLVRFRGTRAWSPAIIRSVEEFFTHTFGRTLPVSAFGQTAVHDRLGFDHRNAVDIAVHPDTPEGRAVMQWLKQAGISYIAFRSAVPGSSTGAHIHIGEPSQRLALPLH